MNFNLLKNLLVAGNGYIEGTELDGFLREFVSSANATDVGPEVNRKDFFSYIKSMRC